MLLNLAPLLHTPRGVDRAPHHFSHIPTTPYFFTHVVFVFSSPFSNGPFGCRDGAHPSPALLLPLPLLRRDGGRLPSLFTAAAITLLSPSPFLNFPPFSLRFDCGVLTFCPLSLFLRALSSLSLSSLSARCNTSDTPLEGRHPLHCVCTRSRQSVLCGARLTLVACQRTYELVESRFPTSDGLLEAVTLDYLWGWLCGAPSFRRLREE